MDAGEIKRRLLVAQSAIADALALIDAPKQVLLDVPYLSQWGEGADERRGDCGPACIAMMAHFLTFERPTVNQAAAACNQPKEGDASGYTMHWQLRQGARHYGFTLETRSKYRPPILTLDLLKAQIDAGEPSIALIHYGVLRDETNGSGFVENQDQNYDRGHWCLFVGYDDVAVYLHDSDFWGQQVNNGKFRCVPNRAFVEALAAVAPGCTVGNQGLIVV